ncbi:MAG TPA: flagellar export chaperone FliS [Phycisphaerae bacterium]|nr:flagellar export chaperone FliS [Phycisphaerae bacterium]
MDTRSNEYLRNAVMTAAPEQLHLMLYDGAVRFTRQGIEAIRGKKWEDAFNGLSRAQKIILEMTSALNYDVDRPLCERMAGLYTFIYRKLVEASVDRNPEAGEEALGLLEYQRETWVLLLDKLRRERTGQTPAGPAPKGAAEPVQAEALYGTLCVEG